MTLAELRRELMDYGYDGPNYKELSDHWKYSAPLFGTTPKAGTYVVVTAKSPYRGEKTYLAPVAWRVKTGDKVKVLQMNNWMTVTKVGTKYGVGETALHVLRYHEPTPAPVKTQTRVQVYAEPGQSVEVYNARTRMKIGTVQLP